MGRFACLAAPLLLVTGPFAGLAQTPAVQEGMIGPYDQLLSILVDPYKGDLGPRLKAREFAEQMVAKLPPLQSAEAARPGLTAAITDAAEPVFAGHSERARAAHRPRLLAALRDTISEDEAMSALEFYRSDTGQMMRERIANTERAADSRWTHERAVDAKAAADAVPLGPGGAEWHRSIETLGVTLSREEKHALDQSVRRYPVLAKLRRFTDASMPIRVEIARTPLSEAELEDLSKALGQGWLRYQGEQR